MIKRATVFVCVCDSRENELAEYGTPLVGENNLQIHSIHFVKSTPINPLQLLTDSNNIHFGEYEFTEKKKKLGKRLEAMVIKLLITIKIRIT